MILTSFCCLRLFFVSTLVVYSKNNVNPCEDPDSRLFKLVFEGEFG